MWTKDSAERQFAWPFRTAMDAISIEGNIELSLNDLSIDTIPFKSEQTDLVSNIAELYSESWDKARISGICTFKKYEEIKASILPATADPEKLRLSIHLMGKRTMFRKSVHLPIAANGTEFQIEIDRDEVFKSVTLFAQLVLFQNLVPESEYAYKKGSIMANSDIIVLHCDEPDIRPGGSLNCKWQLFPDEYCQALYYLDTGVQNGTAPTLYFNSFHKDLQPVIDFKGTRGAKAKLRDAIFSHIAYDVWMDFLYFAQEHQDSEDSEVIIFVERILQGLKKRLNGNYDFSSFLNKETTYSEVNQIKKYLQHSLKMGAKELQHFKLFINSHNYDSSNS
jgi:hypothetical protein